MSLGNADFRAFLSSDAQPSHTQSASSATPEEIAARAKAKAERRLKYAAKAKAHSGARASATEANGSTAESATKYRDRAEERRKGLVRDDDNDVAIDASRFTEQETKHLGGDVEHTHLVKGLDFTLLARVRAEAQQQPPRASEPAQRSAPRVDEVSVSPSNCVARTSLGSRILKLVFPPAAPAQNAHLLPGRVFYSFDLGQKIPPLPKSVVRANDDVPELVHVMTGVEKLVLARVSRAVAEWRDPTACARKLAADRARVAAEQNAVAAAVEAARQALAEADDDIFADAGSYVASIAPIALPEVTDAPASSATAVGESVFDVELRAAQLADEQVAAARRVESSDNDDEDAYPNTDDAYPNTDDAYPNTDDAYPRTIEDEEEPDNGVELDAGDEDSDDVNERARQLLKARGLAVEDDEYGMIGVTSVRLSVARDDDAKSDKRKRGGAPPHEKQVEQKKAQKFDRDLRVVASLVDKKAEARGAKRLIGEQIGAPEKKRK
jgi:hypothetical protein